MDNGGGVCVCARARVYVQGPVSICVDMGSISAFMCTRGGVGVGEGGGGGVVCVHVHVHVHVRVRVCVCV